MGPERFGEGFGMEPSPFADKTEREGSKPVRKLSRRDVLKFAGVVAAGEAGRKLLAKSWDSFAHTDSEAEKGMWEQDFRKVKDFDNALLLEGYGRLNKARGQSEAVETESTIAAVIEPLKSGMEKIVPALKRNFGVTPAASLEDLRRNAITGGILGALTLPVAEKLIDTVRGEKAKPRKAEGTRRQFLASFLGTSGAAAGAIMAGAEREKTASPVFEDDTEGISSTAALMIFDRLVADQPDYKAKPEDKIRAQEYEAVVRLAVNPNNHFSDPKLLPTALERFGAAYYLKSFLESRKEKALDD